MYRIGFDIGGTNIAAGAVDASLAVVARMTRRLKNRLIQAPLRRQLHK